MKQIYLFIALCFFSINYNKVQAQELVIDENNYEEYLSFVENANPENSWGDWFFKDKSVLTGIKKLTISCKLNSDYLNLEKGGENLEEVVLGEGVRCMYLGNTKLAQSLF